MSTKHSLLVKAAINPYRDVDYTNVSYMYGSTVAFTLECQNNYSRIIQELFKNCSRIVQELFKNCSRIVQELFKNCSRIIQESSVFSLDNYMATCLIQFCHQSSIIVGICFRQALLCCCQWCSTVFSPEDISFIVLNILLTNSTDAHQLHQLTAHCSCEHADPH